MTRPAEVTEYLRCGGVNCDNACASMFDRLGVEDCKTWRVHGYVQQLEERIVHLEALNQQNISVITMQERTRARLEEQISQFESCVPRWISVEERLPKAGKAVLILARWGNAGMIIPGWVGHFKTREGETGWVSPHDSLDGKTITHWMPLPEPPEEE